jgi:hypothetical protein
MKRSICLAATAVLFLSAGLLRADDTYPIKMRDIAQGDVYQIQKSETTTVKSKVVDATGKALQDMTQKTIETAVYKETILKCEAGKSPTMVERKYEKAQLTTDDKKTDLAYQGKTVVIEKKDGKFRFTVDGKELPESDAALLAKEFEHQTDEHNDVEKAILPKNPVKVNDSWKVDMEPFIKDAAKGGELELDPKRSKGTVTLVKAYKKDGKQYGEMKVALTLGIKTLGKGEQKLTADEGTVATLEFLLDGCIDGSVNNGTHKGTMEMNVKASVSGVQVNVVVQSKQDETRTELPKK